jgi:hypothetical protein
MGDAFKQKNHLRGSFSYLSCPPSGEPESASPNNKTAAYAAFFV